MSDIMGGRSSVSGRVHGDMTDDGLSRFWVTRHPVGLAEYSRRNAPSDLAFPSHSSTTGVADTPEVRLAYLIRSLANLRLQDQEKATDASRGNDAKSPSDALPLPAGWDLGTASQQLPHRMFRRLAIDSRTGGGAQAAA